MAKQYRMTSLQTRVEIMERSAAGESDQEIADALGWSYWTVRKWRRRGERAGRAGLSTTLGRPAAGTLSSFAPHIPTTIKALRETHPGWGPQTLRVELQKDAQLAATPRPSRSRIAAFLKAEDLTRPYCAHTELDQPCVTEVMAPHEEWELDAQGVQTVSQIGIVSVINIAAHYSRLKVESWGCVGRSKATTADYQLACRRGFLRYGLPQRIRLDHATVFYDSNNRHGSAQAQN